jgi:hypothetical protein
MQWGRVAFYGLLLAAACSDEPSAPPVAPTLAPVAPPAAAPIAPPSVPADSSEFFPAPASATLKAPDPEWAATRKREPPPTDDMIPRLSQGRGRLGEKAQIDLDKASDVPKIRYGSDNGKEIARRILMRTMRCYCEAIDTFVHSSPRQVRIEVDAPTQKATRVVLMWSNGEETTEGPIHDCYMRVLASQKFAFKSKAKSVITFPFMHVGCGVGDDVQ